MNNLPDIPRPDPDGADEIDASRAPLLDHLIELRSRLVFSIAAFLVCFGVCFFYSDSLYHFLIIPLQKAMAGRPDARIIFTAPQEFFVVKMKLAAWGGAFLAFPIVASQIWMFVAPGLYKNERRAFLPFLIATPVLFVTGAALLYYIVLPLALGFFAGQQKISPDWAIPVVLEPRADEYLGLVTSLILAFGICFQLPVLVTLLARIGVVTSQTLIEKGKYAVLGIFIVAAVLTPPDVLSQLSLALPMTVLYGLSILSVKFVEKTRPGR